MCDKILNSQFLIWYSFVVVSSISLSRDRCRAHSRVRANRIKPKHVGRQFADVRRSRRGRRSPLFPRSSRGVVPETPRCTRAKNSIRRGFLRPGVNILHEEQSECARVSRADVPRDAERCDTFTRNVPSIPSGGHLARNKRYFSSTRGKHAWRKSYPFRLPRIGRSRDLARPFLRPNFGETSTTAGLRWRSFSRPCNPLLINSPISTRTIRVFAHA